MGSAKTPGIGVTQRRLPDELERLYLARRDQILSRLDEFRSVPESEWFYECCFCILTPQSSAVHADAVVRRLRDEEFFATGHNVEHHLRNPAEYIRFHRTKHGRLHALREQWSDVVAVLNSRDVTVHERRNLLSERVNGYGLKEASHAMRNIGFRGVAILDRHLLRLLVRCGVYEELPAVSSRSRYWEVEASFIQYSAEVGIDMDELDLLFWCAMTGHILK